jgi:CBS-domain-containing membrane protein
MEGHMPTATARPPSLVAETAADLMTQNVESVPRSATFDELLAFLIDRNLTVALVTGDRGEPVGVVTLTDLAIHVRESGDDGRIAPATAGALMTSAVFTVPADAPAAEVVQDMLRSKVHHLFVTDAEGTIMGVVGTCDVLRHLH